MKPLSEEYRANTIPGYYDIDRMLHVAVQMGDVAQARTLLECGADVHSVFLPAPMQVLTKAVLMHHVEMAKLILEYEDRGKRDHYWGKNTPVRLAKRDGLTELIPLLTLEDNDADEYDSPDDELSEAEQAVVQGAEDGQIEEVRKGLAAGVSVENIYDYVIWDIMDRETPELLDLFAPEKWNQWMLNKGLYWACDRRNAAALHRLLDLGADAHSHGGTQAYFCATQYADLTCMKVMLERGKVDPLQPNVRDSHATAMDELIGMRTMADSVEPRIDNESEDDARDIIRLLQEYGCIEGELVEHGTLAAPCPHLRLLIAAQRGDVAAVRQALADGADVNARGWAGATALMKAARLGHIEMAQLLLDHGADAEVDMYCRKEAQDVNVHHRMRVTALYQAARSGSMEMVQLMLPLITTPELRAREVSQALFPAAARGLNDMIQLFLREGADINIHYTSDFEGFFETEWSPLEYALRNKLDDTIDLLLTVRRNFDKNAHHEQDFSSVEQDSVPASKHRDSRAWSEGRERFYERACQYRDGKGVEKNMDEAIRLFNLAADLGDDFALFLLGKYHADGRYVPKDLEKSYQFYKQSAEQGSLCAQVNLGNAYERGAGTAVDAEKALFWRRKASDDGCPVATNNLACQLLWGEGVRHNRAEGFRLYSHVAADVKNKLCPSDHNYLRVSWYGLGKCYEQGAGVPRDREAALRWYRKSADAGDVDAMCRLGRFYERGIVVEKDATEAAGWYLRAAKRGCTEAHYRIGLCYLRGRGVEKDAALALRHIRRAAADNHKDALYQLGRCYLRGIGVRPSRKRALSYLRRAADEGNKRAMKFLHAPEGAEGPPVHPEERQ